MSRERRRRRGLWRAIVDDPYRKLVAVGLAVLLWFFVNSQTTDNTTRRLPLVVVGQEDATPQTFDRLAVALPTDRVVHKGFFDGAQAIDEVHVVLRGPRFRIEALEGEPVSLLVKSFLTRDWSRSVEGDGENSAETLEFTARDIRRDVRALQEVSIELRPARVFVEVQRIDQIVVPLDVAESRDFVEIDAEAIRDRLRVETINYTPSQAMILGPAIGMEELRRRGPPFFRVGLQAFGNERQVSGTLEIIGGGDLGLRFDPPPILTVQLRPESSTYTLRLPIVVDDLALPAGQRGSYRPEVDLEDVRVRVSGNLRTQMILLGEDSEPNKLQAWAMANLRLQAYIPRPEPGVIYAEEMRRPLYLVPAGPLSTQVERSECLLDETVTVNLVRRP